LESKKLAAARQLLRLEVFGDLQQQQEQQQHAIPSSPIEQPSDEDAPVPPMTCLESIQALSTGLLHLTGEAQLRSSVILGEGDLGHPHHLLLQAVATLKRVPKSASRSQLVKAARKELVAWHQASGGGGEPLVVTTAADVVASCRELLTTEVLKRALMTMFEATASIDRFQQQLQRDGTETNRQRQLNAAIARLREKVVTQVEVFEAVLPLALPPGSATEDYKLDAYSSAETIHSVMMSLQQVFKWPTDCLSSMNPAQLVLARRLVRQVQLRTRAIEEQLILQNEIKHAGHYYAHQQLAVDQRYSRVLHILASLFDPSEGPSMEVLNKLQAAETDTWLAALLQSALSSGQWKVLRLQLLGVRTMLTLQFKVLVRRREEFWDQMMSAQASGGISDAFLLQQLRSVNSIWGPQQSLKGDTVPPAPDGANEDDATAALHVAGEGAPANVGSPAGQDGAVREQLSESSRRVDGDVAAVSAAGVHGLASGAGAQFRTEPEEVSDGASDTSDGDSSLDVWDDLGALEELDVALMEGGLANEPVIPDAGDDPVDMILDADEE
jgi:hypothetical protein